MEEEMEDKMNRPFNNVLKVKEYLVSQGWKISKSSLYNHVKDHKLIPDKQGYFSKAEVDRYTSVNLKNLKDDGVLTEAGQKRLKGIQQQKIETEGLIAKEKLRILERHNTNLDKRVEQRVAHEIVAHLNLYKNVVTNYFTGEAEALISLVKGNQQHIPEFIEAIRKGISQAGATVAQYKGITDIKVTPDGMLVRDNEILPL
jgi:hypothetical protein